MIDFKNNINHEPFKTLYDTYKNAVHEGQENPEAICISSYIENRVDSRYVNLKIVDGDNFIFFSNYNSPKANQFLHLNKVSIVIYWNKISTQIRMQGTIKKTTKEFNQSYFSQRQPEKNALAISSNQSEIIDSFNKVIKKYNDVLQNNDLAKCPDYWGGFCFIPTEIEFWKGSKFRLNKRKLYMKTNNSWNQFILEP